jgi:hypothetical protein
LTGQIGQALFAASGEHFFMTGIVKYYRWAKGLARGRSLESEVGETGGWTTGGWEMVMRISKYTAF